MAETWDRVDKAMAMSDMVMVIQDKPMEAMWDTDMAVMAYTQELTERTMDMVAMVVICLVELEARVLRAMHRILCIWVAKDCRIPVCLLGLVLEWVQERVVRELVGWDMVVHRPLLMLVEILRLAQCHSFHPQQSLLRSFRLSMSLVELAGKDTDMATTEDPRRL
jgi:hypothetical protein